MRALWLLCLSSGLSAVGGCDDDAKAPAPCGASSALGSCPARLGGDAGAALSDAGALPDADARLRVAITEVAALDATPVDARGAAAFQAGHLPGALWVDAAALRATVDGVAGQIPEPATVARAFGAADVAREQALVVYGDASDLTAARLLWTFEYMGHADVRLLDGGFAAYAAAGSAIARGPSVPAEPTAYPDDGLDRRRRVDADWVLAHLDDPDTILIDARSAEEHSAGHIPGARSVDWQRNVEGGVLRPLAELQVLYAGLPRDTTLVAYCQTGSRASMAYFTLRYLGYSDVRLYDGSMADWTADPSRPVAP